VIAMKICVLALSLLCLSVPALAADPTGNWSGLVSTPGGDRPVSFSLKASGEQLTGSMTGPDGVMFTLENGKVDGNNISFSVTVTYNGNQFPLAYKGVVGDEEIKFVFIVNGQEFPFAVKRVK
jgi:hypothetical protein